MYRNGWRIKTEEQADIEYYGVKVTAHFEVDDDIITVHKAEIGGVDVMEMLQCLYVKDTGGPITEAVSDLDRAVSEQWSQGRAGTLMDKARDAVEERMAAE